MIRVLIANDQTLVRVGLKVLIEDQLTSSWSGRPPTAARRLNSRAGTGRT